MHQTNQDTAITALAPGFALLERPLRPVAEGRAGNTSFLHWPETGRRGDVFTHEFYAIDADPANVLADIAALDVGPDHLVAVIATDEVATIDPWLAAGYGIGSVEPVMRTDLSHATPASASTVLIERVRTLDEAAAIATSHAAIGFPVRSCNAALLEDPAIRYLQIREAGAPVCVGKIALRSPCAYITDIVTLPTHRKRGMAGALVRAMEAEARAIGIGQVVLTATAMALPLYTSLGYKTIATQTLLYKE